MATPTVSIGLPVWNGEKYLDETIRSLVTQTFQDLEIVISDNGSTDRTEEICRSWAERDARVRYFRNHHNRGASWNYNQVVEKTRGRYFKWMADDDNLQPEWVSECVAILDQYPDVVVAYTNVVEMDEHGAFITDWTTYSDAMADDPLERLRPVLTDWRCLPVFGLIRRQALSSTRLIGPFDSSDRVLLGELSILGKFHRIEKPLFWHREHPGRSMRAYETQQQRGAWFDPKNTSPLRYWPNWQYQLNFVRAMLRAPLGFRSKLQAVGMIGRRMISARKSLLADFREAGRAIFEKVKPS